jgi:hypothetical protein
LNNPEDQFKFVETVELISGKLSSGVRLVRVTSNREFGSLFQEQCRSMEWKAAYTVYNKYRRKENLNQQDLRDLTVFSESVAESRALENKPIKLDFLVQKVSSELKTRLADRKKLESENEFSY